MFFTCFLNRILYIYIEPVSGSICLCPAVVFCMEFDICIRNESLVEQDIFLKTPLVCSNGAFQNSYILEIQHGASCLINLADRFHVASEFSS